MPELIPVDHDPFNDPPTNLIPVDHDPFASLGAQPKEGQTVAPQNVQTDIASLPPKVAGTVGDMLGLTDAAKALRGEMTPEEAEKFALYAATGLVTPEMRAARAAMKPRRRRLHRKRHKPLPKASAPITVHLTTSTSSTSRRSAPAKVRRFMGMDCILRRIQSGEAVSPAINWKRMDGEWRCYWPLWRIGQDRVRNAAARIHQAMGDQDGAERRYC